MLHNVADCLAAKGLDIPIGVHIFELLPVDCKGLLWSDCMGTCFPRVIRL